MRNTIESRPTFVIGADDVPGRELGAGRFQHHVAGLRVLVPSLVRFEVHRTELPLPQRIVNAGQKTALLLLLSDLKPELDQHDPAINYVLFDLGTQYQKLPVLLLGTKPHDMFNACAIVPTA